MTACTTIDLRAHLNARAATNDDERERGGFNAWGNSFPAEELRFGKLIEVGGLPFLLGRRGALDHLEANGQHIVLPDVPAAALAVLAFGEMGPQRTAIEVGGHEIDVEAAGWLIDGQSYAEGALDCTHLHYPGGYELALLRPVMWPYVFRLPPDARAEQIRIGTNPLFHVAAMTLLA
jgi:hypothetical protein